MKTADAARNEVTITPHARAWYRLARWAFRALGWLLFRITVTGQSNVPRGAYIVAANHLSWIDPFLLMIYLPAEPRLYFLGAQQAVNQGWKGWIMDHFDMLIPVKRGAAWLGREVLERPKRVLAAGAVLGLFPEGRLGSKEGDLLPLERGIGHILLTADEPVLPVAISGAQELYLRKRVTVRIGEPLRVEIGGLGRHEAIDAAVDQVAGALRRLLPAYQEPRPAFKAMRFLSNLLDIGLPSSAKTPGD
jgi:1-acyl-sn-glycerol-3-phosphate acyltransferase